MQVELNSLGVCLLYFRLVLRLEIDLDTENLLTVIG